CRHLEGSIDCRNLLRMDAQLAPKTEAARAHSIGADALDVVETRCDTVDWRRQPGEARHQHQLRTESVQLGAIAIDAKVQLQVDRAERQPRDAWVLGHRVRVPQARCGFDQRIQRSAWAEYSCDVIKGSGTFGLGQNDAGDAGRAAHREVALE